MARCGQCSADLGFGTQCYRCGTQAHGASPAEEQFQWGPPVQPVPIGPRLEEIRNKRIAAGVCGILLGALGVHKFVLGYTTEGLIMLLGSLLTCGLGLIPFAIIGLIEGIVYLTKTDDEFSATYLMARRGWF